MHGKIAGITISLAFIMILSSSAHALGDYALPASNQIGSFYVVYPSEVETGGKYSVGFHYQGKGKYFDVTLKGDKYIKITSKQKTTISGKPAIVFFITIDNLAPVGQTIYLKGTAVAGDNVLLIKERNSVNLPMKVVCHKGSLCFN